MPAQPTERSPHSTFTAALALSLALCGGLAVGGWTAIQKVRALPGVVLPTPKPAHRIAPPRITPPTAAFEEAGPTWASLSSAQQQALEPLQMHWSTLTEAQKRKWIAMAGSFQKLSATDQAKIHGRMAAWAALTPQQRDRARLNFAATRKITPPAKQEQWDAYQALSEEARRALAERAALQGQGAAVAVQPAPPHKFARVPAADAGSARAVPNPPKVLPPVVDMVPVPVPQPATTPATPVESTPATPTPALAEPVPMPSATVSNLPPLPDEPAAATPAAPVTPVAPDATSGTTVPETSPAAAPAAAPVSPASPATPAPPAPPAMAQ